MIKWALYLFKKGEWGAVLTDKDGGFALVKKAKLREEYKAILAQRWYRRTNLRDVGKDVVMDYVQTCEAIGIMSQITEHAIKTNSDFPTLQKK